MNHGAGNGNIKFWGIDEGEDNPTVAAYMIAYGVSNPCASGLTGGGDAVNTLYSSGSFSSFSGYPTYSVICPNKTITFDIWPSTITSTTFDTYFTACGTSAIVDFNPATTKFTTIYPNPATTEAMVDFYLDKNSTVSIDVYNVIGEKVYSLTVPDVQQGFNYTKLPLDDFSNGMYIIKLVQDDNVVDMRKLSVIK